MYVDIEYAAICCLIWMALSFIIGFDFAKWLARKHPQVWKRHMKPTEETLRDFWNIIKRKFGR